MKRIFRNVYRLLLISFILAILGSSRSFAQLTHLDSAVAVRLGAVLAQQFGGEPYELVADSSHQNFIAAIPHGAAAGRVVELHYFSSSIRLKDFKDSSDATVLPVMVNAEGMWLNSGNSVAHPWQISQTIAFPLTAADRVALETNRDRYVLLEREPATSFWSGIAEPALVVLGAIAIVALFFLIRS